MSKAMFRAWFSDVGFTCRVLIICDMLDEFATQWEALEGAPFREAIEEVRETALLEMTRYEIVGMAAGYLYGPGKDLTQDKSVNNLPQ